ncbi:MAG: hypothetical protein SGJ04_09825 [Bacteroidota bacterium]|nr:hypothetical protein [Bacteroidota bacterium]
MKTRIIRKGIAVALVAALGMSQVSAAAPINPNTQTAEKTKKSPSEMAVKQAKNLKKQLVLTDDQESSLVTIFTDRNTKIQDARVARTGKGDGTSKTVQNIMKASDEKVKGVLTADQYTKYQSIMAEKKEKIKEKKAKK